MTKLVIVTGKEMCKIVSKIDFIFIRQKGSHTYWRHKDGRATIIPIHPGEKLGRGMIRKILRDIEISVEEYDNLKKRIKKKR